MSAGTNSRGNANEILGQSQYLSNYTPTPPLTTNSQLMTSQVNVGLEEGYCVIAQILALHDPNFY